MTVESKSLVERQMEIREAFDGDSVPRKNIALRHANDEIERLLAQIERLERENKELRIQDDPSFVSAFKARAEVAEAELTRLKSPMEGAETTAAEREKWSSIVSNVTPTNELVRISALIRDLDHATAQARSAADDENEACARIVEGYISDYDIEHNPSATEAFRRAAASIRARRKGETGNV